MNSYCINKPNLVTGSLLPIRQRQILIISSCHHIIGDQYHLHLNPARLCLLQLKPAVVLAQYTAVQIYHAVPISTAECMPKITKHSILISLRRCEKMLQMLKVSFV